MLGFIKQVVRELPKVAVVTNKNYTGALNFCQIVYVGKDERYYKVELFYNETAEQVELPKTLSLENAKAVIEEYAKKFTFNIGSQENWFEELKVIGAELGYHQYLVMILLLNVRSIWPIR